jgi:N-hydroxyarylamine O-acetyltransferase
MASTAPSAQPFHLDLDRYFRRIGHQGPDSPTMETLEALHLRHLAAIPFENLDPVLGRPVRLDLASLQAKIVDAGRGGYCFEQNTLFAAVLRGLGFAVTTLEARVRPPGASQRLGRTHGVLRVDLAGAPWLVDVGFGGDGILGPVPLDGGEIQRHGERHRVAAEGRLGVLQTWVQGGWRDVYEIHPDEVFPIDWMVANHYTSTHPESRFVRFLTVQIPTPECRRVLKGRTLTETRQGAVQVRQLQDEEVVPLLRTQFNLRLPADFLLPPLADFPL